MSSSPVSSSIETGLHAAQPIDVIKVLVQRSMMRVRRMPSAFIPSLIMPVFQLVAFSGAFGFAVTSLGIKNALDWYVPLNAIQGASFGAVGVSFALINDMQTGFFDRITNYYITKHHTINC